MASVNMTGASQFYTIHRIHRIHSIHRIIDIMILIFLMVGNFLIPLTTTVPVPKNSRITETVEPIVFFDELNQHDYSEYTKEVFNELQNDKEFLKEVDKNMGAHSVEQYAEYLNSASNKARTKLDEIKRREISRLNKLEEQLNLKRRQKKRNIKNEQKDEIYKASRSHISSNDNSEFKEEDLKALIARVKHDINMVDKVEEVQYRRRRYRKQIKERIKLRNSKDPEERKKIYQKYSDREKKNQLHSKIHEPGSEEQMKEVWFMQDHLDPQSFDSKTFFKLHDLNQDDNWDISEVEALLQTDINKVYDTNNKEVDSQERFHETMKMRQNIMEKMDTNKDQLISLTEFQEFEKTAEYKKDEEWKISEEVNSPLYTQEDWKNYKEELDSILEKHVLPEEINNDKSVLTNLL